MGKPNNCWIRQRRAELASKVSDAERAAYRNLQKLGLQCIRQYPIWTGRKMYFADLYLPKINTILEIDGAYHFTRTQKRFDTNRSSGLWRLGFHVVRLNNHDARDITKIKSKILFILHRKY